MRKPVKCAWAAVFLLMIAAIGARADEQAERARFVGVWKGFTVEGKGENPDRGPVKLEITITENTMHGIQIREDGNIDHGVGEYTLNLATDPAQLDAAKTRGTPPFDNDGQRIITTPATFA
jgi:hypothetical protein